MNPLLIAPVAQRAQHSRRPVAHFIHSLDQWLDDHGGDFTRLQGRKFLERTDKIHRQSELAKAFEKQVHSAERCRAHGVAVITIRKGHNPVPLRRPGLHAELHGHFQGALHGSGAIVGKKHPLQRAMGKKSAQLRRQLGGAGIAEAQIRAVRDFSQLPIQRIVDPGMSVSVDVGPDRRIAIEVLAPLGIPQPHTLAAGDDQALAGRIAPISLIGEGMPAMLLIPCQPLR